MQGRPVNPVENYQITERWRGVEQPLDEQSKILDIWNAWGTAQSEVSKFLFCSSDIINNSQNSVTLSPPLFIKLN